MADNDLEFGLDDEEAGFIDTSSMSSSAIVGSKHPKARFFHLFFKIAALCTYLFAATIFGDNFILIFVACILLLAFDFWTVKNITGRLLVGLRWWNEIKDDGSNVWIYESKPNALKISNKDSSLFWWTLYLFPVIWFFLAIIAIATFELQWLVVDLVAITLNSANLIGYWK